MKKLKKYLIAFVVCFPFVPTLVLAAGAPQNFQQLITRAIELISMMVPLLVSLAVLFFLYGVARFIYYADNDTERAKGKQHMIWGIVALFVMVSVWPLVNILKETVLGSSGGSSWENPDTGEIWRY